MKFTGKLVGGAVGLLALGPLGAALGVLVGHQFDEQSESENRLGSRSRERIETIGDHFFRAAFRVMGHVAKADGRVSEREIAAARAVMADLRLGSAQIQAAIECFTAGKGPGYDLSAELATLANLCRGRPDLLRVFMEIQVRAALAGSDMQGPARALLGSMASRLGVSILELAQIEAVLRIRSGRFRPEQQRSNTPQQLEEAYRVLEAAPTATDHEIVKAYRRQLSRHHPDKLKANGLPDSMVEHAKQRTQQIIEAYELIKIRRGI
ncbi:MAG TPA: co-chaperone DjlA [Steroidobacteraceae bacterium]|nr:co-chaperone DjlA [Steroidobacteraceae bacterium]